MPRALTLGPATGPTYYGPTYYGPTYGSGDVVGCGIDIQSGVIFFTKNGKCLGKHSDPPIQQSSETYFSTGTIFTKVQGRLFPVIGIGERDVQILANFGEDDFFYKSI